MLLVDLVSDVLILMLTYTDRRNQEGIKRKIKLPELNPDQQTSTLDTEPQSPDKMLFSEGKSCKWQQMLSPEVKSYT